MKRFKSFVKTFLNRLIRRFSSVRVRLSLWNTLTFALVLITLRVAFRFLAWESEWKSE